MYNAHRTSMSLLSLPAELRLQIYQNLPHLRPGRSETVAPRIAITPAISRVNCKLRQESLPIYAENAHFFIQADEESLPASDRVAAWLFALGSAIKHVRSFQLSRHWIGSHPTRWQGHVGFYVRLERLDDAWQVKAGTYPIAGDIRAMRAESVELLQYVVRQNVVLPLNMRDKPELQAQDVQFVAAAIAVVATHPISAVDTEQSVAGGQRRRKAWSQLEGALLALKPAAGEHDVWPSRTLR
ncbi:hypothetical protein BAUCODRAFT_23554 [Baudoinia panamericana UAMH 10762]|uniref:F-box domain-containing protein n=1 Tax=Baudoinia panamericana (strain UAMH 10762) TaxID=717646 RepID=M2LRU2_BAUPA|nr:uncharacterized protein BAUCODRAFT_23554 [Baudoinia panamericana UAMH 10762]EMC97192.1 hypothetical protein BAUCODRAFT_23554 [Baudoinia panamericana UAMH 10762]